MPRPEDCAKLPDPKPESNMTLNAQMEMLLRPAHDRLARPASPPAGPSRGRTSGWPSRRTPTRTCSPWPWTRCRPWCSPPERAAGRPPWTSPGTCARCPPPGWLTLIGSGRLISDGWFDEEVEAWDSQAGWSPSAASSPEWGAGDTRAVSILTQ